MRYALTALCLLTTSGCSLFGGSDAEIYEGLYSIGAGAELEFYACPDSERWAIRRDDPDARELLERWAELSAEAEPGSILGLVHTRVRGTVEARADGRPLLDVEEVLEAGTNEGPVCGGAG